MLCVYFTMLFEDWIPSAASKQAAFHSLAEYYQGQQHKANKEFGEEIARLKVSRGLQCLYFENYYTFVSASYFTNGCQIQHGKFSDMQIFKKAI